jgi:glycosyltransferase involved in cell wall biosynthesis
MASNTFLYINAYRVSIITSIYIKKKSELQFLAGFLQDIIRQTIFHECELLLIDAHSPENGDTIVKEYLDKYPNIQYIKLEADPGLFGVWNLGIKKASAQYITNANIDDRLKPECYEVHASYLDAHPDVDLVYSGCYITHKPHETFENNSSQGQLVAHSILPFDRIQQLYNWVPYVNNHPMWRKSLHNRYGLFDKQYKATGGMDMWIRTTICGNAKFVCIPQVYGLYYHNPNGLSTAKNSRDKIEREQIIKKYKELYEKYFKHVKYLN